jgi:hypothetical protein
MKRKPIEEELKKELVRIGSRLEKTHTLQSAAMIGSAAGAGVILATMAGHIPIVAGMAVGGLLFNLAVTRFLFRKRPPQ